MLNKNMRLVRLAKVVFYSIFFAAGMNLFLIPMGLLATGVAGISQIIADFTPFDYGLIYLLINIPGIVLGFTKLGGRFTLYSMVSIFSVSIASAIIPQQAITQDIILNCLFGGIFTGFSLGNLLKVGTSSGGTDFYGIWVEQKYGKSFSNVNLVINIIIISVAGILYGTEIGLYTFLSFFIRNSMMSQIFILNDKMTVWIIADDLTRVSTYINQVIGHGTTIIEGTGGYTQKNKQVLMTILTHYEYSLLADAVLDICPQAFINVNKVALVKGNFKPKKRVTQWWMDL